MGALAAAGVARVEPGSSLADFPDCGSKLPRTPRGRETSKRYPAAPGQVAAVLAARRSDEPGFASGWAVAVGLTEVKVRAA
jgi:hypothetical protein